MAENPIKTPLPADLPENWLNTQTIAAAGADVGLSKQHGYNYLMQQVNAAQNGVNLLGSSIAGLTPATLGAVPTTRKVNGLSLNSDINLTPGDIGITAKRTCTYVIGTSTAGWTEADCDFLCDGVDDDSEFSSAITLISNSSYKKGKIVVLPGAYKISSTLATTASIDLVGSGKKTTIFQIDSWDSFQCPYEDKVVFRLLGESKISHLSITCPAFSTYAVDLVSDVSELNYVGVIPSSLTATTPLVQVNGIVGAKYICNCTVNTMLVRISSYSIVVNSIFEGNIIYANQGIETPSDSLSVSAENARSTLISNNVIYRLDIDNAINVSIYGNRIGEALYCKNVGAVSIIGNTFRWNGPQFIKAVKCAVLGNICYNAGKGIEINQTTLSVIDGNVFVRKEGAASDYSSTQYTIRLAGTQNSKNLISNNLIYGKNYTSDGGTGNTFVNNKYN